MLFNSLHFVIFFIFVTTLYYTINWRLRWILLLAASAYFYASFIPAYLLILGVVIVIDYAAGIWIENSAGKKRRWILILSLVANVGFLAFFKYFDFLSINFSALLGFAGQKNQVPLFRELYPSLILPIGLSFHTFQSMSYTIEVYRGNQKAEKNFGIYALYVLFYPQLVAGPIERPQNVLWQFHKKMEFDWENIRIGLWMIAWGLFKKVVIADRLALVTDHAFGDVAGQNASTLIIAVVFYSFQIYCDFSGYSDIAIGTARTMGFKLMTNFRAPYFSASISEFWKRWHISLSTWFRDYVYIPLGGNRVGKSRLYINTMIVFLLSGLWHGADWKFIIWGGIHGIYLILAQFMKGVPWWPASNKNQVSPVVKTFHVIWTFLLVAIAWIFFRAGSTAEAIEIISVIFDPAAYAVPKIGINGTEFGFCMFLIALLMFKDYYLPDYVPQKPAFWLSFFTVSFLCYLFGVFNSNQFIYFQF
ncbi:MBOAT family O-acyltransferase [Dyadobacter sediminis]|uniref:MBOAT family protein n=1 Tax=Dyadobacter sediminis TaxID=1493691 RepID=A0A5R9KFC4_9BACT|nr:MBOAT family O-acyltransferase [Dyadobacter sediminis]TLU94842.1 MBOAT family protein [Dyadobacter sediminis]GGB87504.1 alginate O-acetyltransferase [Dyadobacter sediminis]